MEGRSERRKGREKIKKMGAGVREEGRGLNCIKQELKTLPFLATPPH